MKSGGIENRLIEKVKNDSYFEKILPELPSIMDPKTFIGCAAYQVSSVRRCALYFTLLFPFSISSTLILSIEFILIVWFLQVAEFIQNHVEPVLKKYEHSSVPPVALEIWIY